MKKIKIIFKLLILPAIIFIFSCKQINKSFENTLHGRPIQSKEDAFFSDHIGNRNSANLLADKNHLLQAETSLRNIPELKGKPINVFDNLHFYDDGRIMIQIQDPDTLGNINEYDYSRDKEWGPRTPVKIENIGGQAVRPKTIPLDSIRFVTVAKMTAIYADSVKNKGSNTRLDHLYYVEQAHRWYCNDIEGNRSNYEIFFNANGTVNEFKKR
jgi:hypothetical protein